jgi:hypothetical protein
MWEQHDHRIFQYVPEKDASVGEADQHYEAVYRWCMDQFDKKDWSRFRCGPWSIRFLNDTDATAFKLRWC